MNTEHPTRFPNVFYINNPQHRDNNPNKSQWLLSEQDERTCFEDAFGIQIRELGLVEVDVCFGLWLVNDDLIRLGTSAQNSNTPNRELFIAKFVDGNQNSRWHGYPADHRLKKGDTPTEILPVWVRLELITASEMRKISQQKRCKRFG